MKEKKRLYCYLEFSEKDNTVSCEKQWKTVFISYLSHILNHNYQLLFTAIKEDAASTIEIERDKDVFLHLKIISNQTNTPVEHNGLSSLFDTTATIGILKEPLEIALNDTVRFPLFDFCSVDNETGLPIKNDQLFEKENINVFLSKVSDLAFEINLLLNGPNDQASYYIYLAEASYELSSVRYSVKKELIKRGYRVLPEKTFPVRKEDLQEHIQQDLKKSVLSIHFFGNHVSDPHPQTGLQMDVFQNSIAADFFKEQSSLSMKGENNTVDFRRIIWMPENPRIKNEKHLKYIDALKHNYALYAGSDLIRSSPEELKDIILQKLSGHTNKAEGASSTITGKVTESSENENRINRVDNTTISSPQHGLENFTKIILPEETNFFL